MKASVSNFRQKFSMRMIAKTKSRVFYGRINSNYRHAIIGLLCGRIQSQVLMTSGELLLSELGIVVLAVGLGLYRFLPSLPTVFIKWYWLINAGSEVCL